MDLKKKEGKESLTSSSTTRKRILKEIKEMNEKRNENYFAEPIENDIFTWHFTIRGPKGSDFENGIYHGILSLPFDYPLKPPTLYFLNVSLI